MLNRNAKPYKVGCQLGESIAATSNILYLLDNKEQFLSGVVESLMPHIKETQQERDRKQQEYASKVGEP